MAKIDTAFCKRVDQLRRDAIKGKTWHSDGVLAVKASKTSNDAHAFYFRHAITKRRHKFAGLSDLTCNGGSRTLKEIRTEAEHLAKEGPEAPAIENTPSLRTCIDTRILNKSKKTGEAGLRESTVRDLRWSLETYAYDWLDLPVSELTAPRIAARAREINIGRYKNPYYGMDAETLKNLGRRPARKPLLGTERSAAAFIKYLSLTLTGTSAEHGITRDTAPTRAVRNDVIVEHEASNGAKCISDADVAAILNLSRDECSNLQDNGFNPALWHNVLATRLLLLTGYRCSDVASLTRGQIGDTWVTKEKGEAAKSGRRHRLPISSQIRDVLDEALAMKNGDLKTLRINFKWPGVHLNTVADVPPNMAEQSEFVFPSFSTGKQFSQSTHFARRTIQYLKKVGRIEGGIRPHDLRSTFATHCVNADVDLLLVSILCNHRVKHGAEITRKYVTEDQLDKKLIKAMQDTSDHLYSIARVNQ